MPDNVFFEVSSRRPMDKLEYDFYYSEQQIQYYKTNEKEFPKQYFKQKLFTSAVIKGSKPNSMFTDHKYLGTGTTIDCYYCR